jgi:septum formation protein
MQIFNKKIILASKSPRRSQLLKEAGFHFEIKTKEVDEIYPEDMPAEQVAPYLAELKAMACREFLRADDEILLTSDCVVILDGKIYGKPNDLEDAKMILRALSGRVHTVMTGVCLLSNHKKKVFSAISKVHFDELDEEEINYYLEKYQPYDKAGSYAIQEWIGLCKISKIEGTYSNIMGLPMDAVYKELLTF